jgi:hypothetical protein
LPKNSAQPPATFTYVSSHPLDLSGPSIPSHFLSPATPVALSIPPVHYEHMSSAQSTSLTTSIDSPSSPLQQTIADQADLLATFKLDITSLKLANNIREAIKQVQRGEVKAIRDHYCPKSKREASNPVWSSIKNAISRRERLHLQLQTQFLGDEERFFAFFTLTADEIKKRRKARDQEGLRGMRKIVESISKMEADVQKEKALPKYHGSEGTFSLPIWDAAWQDQNDWEVWRQLGLENY